MQAYFRFVVVLMLAAVGGGALALLGDSPADAQTEVAETRTVALDEGWNLVGWTGPDAAFQDAIADIVAQAQVAATFNAATQAFDLWNTDAPDFLNALTDLPQGTGVWLRVTEATPWPQPALVAARSVSLQPDFNLVMWTGPSGVPVEEAFAGLEGNLEAAFTFDARTQSTRTYRPAGPAFLSDLDSLDYGQGVWLLMQRAATWNQAATTPAASVTVEELGVTLDIPAGALPAGVAPEDLSITDGSANPAFQPTSGPEPLLVLQLEPSGVRFAEPVTLTTQVALPSGAAPIVILISDNDVEAVPGVTLAFDAESDLTTLAIPLPHFSGMTVSGLTMTEGPEFIDVGTVGEGEQFTVSVPIMRLDFQFKFEIGSLPLREGFKSEQHTELMRPVPSTRDLPFFWAVDATFLVKSGALTPPRVPSAEGPFLRLVAQDGSTPLVPEAVFTCTAPGDFSILFEGKTDVGAESTRTWRISSETGETTTHTIRDDDFEHATIRSAIIGTCVAHPATFELLTATTFQPTSNIFGADGVHIIVAAPEGGLDVQTALPITLSATDRDSGEAIDLTPNAAGDTAVIPEPTAQNCRGATGCSLTVGPITVSPGTVVRLVATDKDGNMIAWQDYEAPPSGN